MKKVTQFIKFGLVGVSNTIISYAVYILLLKFSVHYLLASAVGFLASIVNAYFWNERYVFEKREGEERVWWRALLKTFTAYAGTGLVLNNILLLLWIDVCQISEMIAPVINLLITIPANFVLNKYWAFRDRS